MSKQGRKKKLTLENTEEEAETKLDNPDKMATQVHKTKTNKAKTQYNMCWIPLYINKHKQRKTLKRKLTSCNHKTTELQDNLTETRACSKW
jgi:acetyl-CoA carboxylase carboxyltransferase component